MRNRPGVQSWRHLWETLPKWTFFQRLAPNFEAWQSAKESGMTWECFCGRWLAFWRNLMWRCWRCVRRSLAPLIDCSALFGRIRQVHCNFLYLMRYCTTFYMELFGNGVQKGAKKTTQSLRRRCVGTKALRETQISVLESSRATLCDGEVVIMIYAESPDGWWSLLFRIRGSAMSTAAVFLMFGNFLKIVFLKTIPFCPMNKHGQMKNIHVIWGCFFTWICMMLH